MANRQYISVSLSPKPDAAAGAADSYLRLELDNDRNEGKTLFPPGSTAYIRVFHSADYEFESSAGTLRANALDVALAVEDETHEFKKEQTASLTYVPEGSVDAVWFGKPSDINLSISGRDIRLNRESLGILTCQYDTTYDVLSLQYNGSGDVMVLVSDDAGNDAVITVSFGDENDELLDDDDFWNVCGSIKIENRTTSINPGDTAIIAVYGQIPNRLECSTGALVTTHKLTTAQQISNERITITNGVGSAAYPISKKYAFGISYAAGTIYGADAEIREGSDKILVRKFRGDPEYAEIIADISYRTTYREYRTIVPADWKSEKITITAYFEGCESKSTDVAVSAAADPEYADITIHLSDNVSGAPVSGATVHINGINQGLTDGDGKLIIYSHPVGTFPITFTGMSNHIDSTADELQNDEIVIGE